ncbi:hypothetical protein K402DRAFT_392859 [Aulographum hederae CBS 113979]|uniref:Uncharacterized protein n=1 Tax=Aulographum hederae CBS 113979 TaxID=1176131 RepID=A0A6G1H2C9_9PEZI|nr:hypothetical protein K402DRAFT_392859 [Aulographum hederae CBS 113979]
MTGNAHGPEESGQGAANVIKKGWATFHGAGEAIRGNFNTFADSVTNTDSSRSKAVTNAGMNEVHTGEPMPLTGNKGAGVTPADHDATRAGREGKVDIGHEHESLAGTGAGVNHGVNDGGVAGETQRHPVPPPLPSR